jgi:hypothetical protein
MSDRGRARFGNDVGKNQGLKRKPGRNHHGRVRERTLGWKKSDAKILVGDCRVLNIGFLVREDVVRPHHHRQGGLSWTQAGEKVASIGYVVDTREDEGTLRLNYTVGRDGQEKVSKDYRVLLVTSSLVSGGRRWWFRCTASRYGGPPCRRRVGKMYLPPGGEVFACRHCYDLAYTSSRTSRKWDGMYKAIAADTGLSCDLVKSMMDRD